MTNHPTRAARMLFAAVLAMLLSARQSTALPPTTLPGGTRGTILEPMPPVGSTPTVPEGDGTVPPATVPTGPAGIVPVPPPVTLPSGTEGVPAH
jgi:hypothetical protein